MAEEGKGIESTDSGEQRDILYGDVIQGGDTKDNDKAEQLEQLKHTIFDNLLPDHNWGTETDSPFSTEQKKYLGTMGAIDFIATHWYGEEIMKLLADKPEGEALKDCLVKNFPEDLPPTWHFNEKYLETAIKGDNEKIHKLRADLEKGVDPYILAEETGLIEIKDDIMSKFHNGSLLLYDKKTNKLNILPIFRKKEEVVGMNKNYLLEFFPEDVIEISKKTMEEVGAALWIMLAKQIEELEDYVVNPLEATKKRNKINKEKKEASE